MMINAESHPLLIKLWQEFLNHEVGKIKPDGKLGLQTENATKKFQHKYGLEPDGIVGNNTISKAKDLGFKQVIEVAGAINVIFDISHHQKKVDLKEAKEFGMLGLFHKATEGTGFHDEKYLKRKDSAISNGLLWGAYHFGTGGSGKEQANKFLEFSAHNSDTLLVLDLERNTTKGESTMSLAEAEAFVRQIEKKTGKYPGIYGGHYLKEITKHVEYTILSHCWLWVSQYSTSPKLPKGWSDYRFWQYTDGNPDPNHEAIHGVGRCDRSMFKGDSTELNNFWVANSV